MVTAPRGDITQRLTDWRNGDADALQAVLPVLNAELRRQARRYLRGERAGHTLASSDLINEAYLRLVKNEPVDWQSRAHFFGVAVTTMRHILVDYARGRNRAKRGRGGQKVSLEHVVLVADDHSTTVIAIHEALDQLAIVSPRRARIVELRYFGGLTEQETAVVVGVSVETVRREWRAARAWLSRLMQSPKGQ